MRRRAWVAVVLFCCAFGTLTGWLGADQGRLAAAFANLSAPWLIVALLPGLMARSNGRGALAGALCTLAALTAFYVTKTLVLSGQNGGGGFAAEFLVEARANRIYFLAGAVTGPLFGFLGALLRRQRRRPSGVAIAGLLMSTEIMAVAVASGRQLLPRPFYFNWAIDDWRVYWLESSVGVVLTVLATAWDRSRAGGTYRRRD